MDSSEVPENTNENSTTEEDAGENVFIMQADNGYHPNEIQNVSHPVNTVSIAMVTNSEGPNSHDQMTQNVSEQNSLEIITDSATSKQAPALKILKIANSREYEGENTGVSSAGNIILDEAVLRAILLATSGDGKHGEFQSAVLTDTENTNQTEFISYEDGNETVITIVQSDDNQIHILPKEDSDCTNYILSNSSEIVQQYTADSQPVLNEFPAEKLCNINSTTQTECKYTNTDPDIEFIEESEYSLLPVTTDLSKFKVNKKGEMKLTSKTKLNNQEKVNSSKSKGLQGGEIMIHCDTCKKDIRKSYYKFHCSLHTGEKKYMCDVCDKGFMTSQHLRRHQVVHSKEKPYPCEICSNSYTQSSHLKIHMRSHNNERNYECSVCKKRFFQSQNLKRHMISHSSDRPYKCTECEKTFKFKDHLIDHERVHSEVPLYKCDICNLPCRTRSALFAHKICHSPEKMAKYKKFQKRKKEKKNFDCVKCGRLFVKERNLNEHKCGNLRKFDYTCDICSRHFLTRISLLRHRCRKAMMDNLRRTHSCMTCGERHLSEHMLREHQLYAHIKNTTFSCDICGYKIIQDKITSHVESHVGKMGTYKCHLCEEEFNSVGTLKKHMTSHPQESETIRGKASFYCKICDKTFKSERRLVSHLNIHSGEDKEYCCHICDLEFDVDAELIDHLKTHTNDTKSEQEVKEFTCDACSKVFIRQATFTKHVAQHKGENKPYKCHLCPEEFEELSACHQHILKKNCSKIIKLYACKFCDRTYSKQPCLNDHLKSHLGTNDTFKCLKCFEEFVNEDDLKDHCKVHIEKTVLHQCSLCKRPYNNKFSLQRHMERHSGTEKLYKCTECSEEFDEEENLYNHVKNFHQTDVVIQQVLMNETDATKPFCDICGKYFRDQWRLKRHLQSYVGKVKRYRCHKCPEEFDKMMEAKLHMEQVHPCKESGPKELQKQCNICKKVLKNGNSYYSHCKTHQGHKKKYRCQCNTEFDELGDVQSHIKENLVIMRSLTVEEELEMDKRNENCFLKCKCSPESPLLKYCTKDGFNYEEYVRNEKTILKNTDGDSTDVMSQNKEIQQKNSVSEKEPKIENTSNTNMKSPVPKRNPVRSSRSNKRYSLYDEDEKYEGLEKKGGSSLETSRSRKKTKMDSKYSNRGCENEIDIREHAEQNKNSRKESVKSQEAVLVKRRKQPERTFVVDQYSLHKENKRNKKNDMRVIEHIHDQQGMYTKHKEKDSLRRSSRNVKKKQTATIQIETEQMGDKIDDNDRCGDIDKCDENDKSDDEIYDDSDKCDDNSDDSSKCGYNDNSDKYDDNNKCDEVDSYDDGDIGSRDQSGSSTYVKKEIGSDLVNEKYGKTKKIKTVITDFETSHSSTDGNVSTVTVFMCYICEKEFTNRNLLKTHLNEHGGETKGIASSVQLYMCHLCGSLFERKEEFKLHEKKCTCRKK